MEFWSYEKKALGIIGKIVIFYSKIFVILLYIILIMLFIASTFKDIIFFKNLQWTEIYENLIAIVAYSYWVITWTSFWISLILANLFRKQKLELQRSIIEMEDISTILKKVWKILRILKLVLFFKKIIYFLSPKKVYVEITNYLKSELTIYTLSLNNLRSDLMIRLDEQKKSLESAKSEVESNIKWSSKLEQVSEIQRIRLDRQIEQFEELQSVLN